MGNGCCNPNINCYDNYQVDKSEDLLDTKKKTEKLVIIFDGIENLSQPAQFQIFSLMKKSDRNLKFIILTRKNRPILKIFQKFFLPPILKNSSVKMISKKIREKFFFRKNTKK